MSIENRWHSAAIWLVVSALAVLSCSINLSSAKLDGEYIPTGNDSFYHARRILDTAQDPAAFYQFDTRIHAPEGSLLVWPWGYDYAMARIVRVGTQAGLSADPMGVLMWIPVAAVLISLALLIVIARRLKLSSWATALAGLCMALAPTTQLLHGVGAIDHHFAEFIFILAALASGLAWLDDPKSTRASLAVAITLGCAPAIHNGLFVVQVPLLATLFLWWMQHRSIPAKNAAIFAAALVLSTIAILLPSLPFRLGRFEFYTLSWFHLYIAACTAAVVMALSRLKFTRGVLIGLMAAGLAALVPIISEVMLATSFIGNSIEYLSAIGEMQSPLRLAQLFGTSVLGNYYSYLIWIAPLTVVLCAIKCWRDRNSPRLLFWLTSLLGLGLLSMQIRLHYFGGFALYLPWLVLLQEFVDSQPLQYKKSFLLASLGLLLLYVPPLRHQLIAPMPKGNDLSFENIQPIFAALRKTCEKDPGIVLADNDAGHFIRYYTGCSVIANNFLLTPQQMEKTHEVLHLLSLRATQLYEEAPQVKYVLLRPFKIGPGPEGRLRYTFVVPQPKLANDLLLGNASTVPPQFHLLDEVNFAELGNAPYAKLYRIERSTPASGSALATTSAGNVTE